MTWLSARPSFRCVGALVALSLGLAPLSAAAQPVPPGVTAMVQAFQTWATANGVANAQLVISRDGLEIGTSTVGSWTVDSVAPIASTSKAITASCVVSLLDAGRIALTDTVATLAPTFTRSLNTVGRSNAALITVEQLLRHTSGLKGNNNPATPREPTQVSYATGAADANPDQWFGREALNQPLTTAAGTSFAYANVNYALLGLIIAAVTSETYENYCRRMVLTPRGAGNARIASGNAAMAAFGGWSISARDYAHFYWGSFNRAALSQRAVDFMDRVYDTSCATCGYGLGVGVTPVGYSLSQVSFPTPAPSDRRRTVMIPVLHPDVPPYNLYHTGDWSGSTTPRQFSSIAAFWSNGVTAVMIDDRSLGSALDALYNALSTPALTLN